MFGLFICCNFIHSLDILPYWRLRMSWTLYCLGFFSIMYWFLWEGTLWLQFYFSVGLLTLSTWVLCWRKRPSATIPSKWFSINGFSRPYYSISPYYIIIHYYFILFSCVFFRIQSEGLFTLQDSFVSRMILQVPRKFLFENLVENLEKYCRKNCNSCFVSTQDWTEDLKRVGPT